MEAIISILGIILCGFGFAIGYGLIYFERMSFRIRKKDGKESSDEDLKKSRKNILKGSAIALFFGILIILIINQ